MFGFLLTANDGQLTGGGGLDKFRIDYEGLYLFIIQLLSYETIETLKNFNEPDTNRNIINALLRTGRSSPYKFALKLGERLLLLAGNDEELVTLITHYQQEQKREEEKQKYKVIAALFIVLIICVVIYFAGK